MAALEASSRIVIIGGGKMGEAILGGLLASDVEPAGALSVENFLVANPGQARRDHLHDAYGVRCVADAREAEGADIVFLAVKPQVMIGMLETLGGHSAYEGGASGPLFVSIAAGLSTARLEGALPAGSRVVRTMPNTPLLVSKGATAVCAGSKATDEDVRLVRDLFSCMGDAALVPESQMDAICAISGSGPAYVAHMVEALRDAGTAVGLDAGMAEAMALQTVYGTAALMVETGQSPEQTRISVCSPGGTTLAALDAMAAAGFDDVISAGVKAAVKRGEELGKL